MRANENAHIHLIAQVKIYLFFGTKNIAFTRYRHSIGIAFRSNCIMPANVIDDFCSSVTASVVLRYCIEVRPSPCTTALICAELPSKDRRTINQICGAASIPLPINSALVRNIKSPVIYTFPHKVELILIKPDISTRAANRVLLRFGSVL
jgi:hypothetical protein